jgi:hypothetical protein
MTLRALHSPSGELECFLPSPQDFAALRDDVAVAANTGRAASVAPLRPSVRPVEFLDGEGET